MTSPRRPHAKRRGGKPSTYAVRSSDLARLFYAANKNEMDLAPSRAGDIATREVLADALEERGLTKLAMELRNFNRLRRNEPLGPLPYDSDRLFGRSLLRAKVERAIFGPQWPDWFFDEIDTGEEREGEVYLADDALPHPTREGVWVRRTEDAMGIYRPRWVARGRVLEGSWSGGRGTAYVPGQGVVEFRG